MYVPQDKDLSAHLGQIDSVRQNIGSNVEIGPRRNAQILGEMSAANSPKKNVSRANDQYKSLMKKTSVHPRKNVGVRNIGKNASKEKKFG